MKTIKLVANYFYETLDMVRTKEGERCLLLNVGDTIFTSGSYMPTDHDHILFTGNDNYVIAICEVME